MLRAAGIWIAVTLVLGVAAPAQTLAPQILMPKAFTERFAEALGAAVPSATVAVKQELRLTIRLPDGNVHDVNLSNVYGEYRGQPERFSDLVEIFTRAAKEPISPKLQPARIVPMIKDRAWVDDVAPIFRKRGDEPLFESLNSELVIAYVEDSDTRSRYLNTSDDVGDRKNLRALAIANLKRILPKIQLRQQDDAVAMITAGGNYEPSLLLVDEIWSSGQIKVDGDIVVAIPARDSLLVTGSNSRKGLEMVRAMADKLADGPYRVTRTLFVYREGRFIEFGQN